MKIWIGLLLSITANVSPCTAQCRITESTCVCTDIDEIPSSLPNGITSLYVNQSLSLTSISQLPASITSLTLNNVGVSTFKANAISNVSATLRELDIRGANSLKEIDFGTPWNPSASALKVLVIMNCSALSKFDNIAEYENLQSITITSTNIQSISSNMFGDISYVTFLDVSYNEKLSFIDYDAFEHMYRLKVMNMTGCSLDRLYGNYFNVAFENGNLDSVTALHNPYRCDEMCDFMSWYWNHRSFSRIANIGTCNKFGYDYTIYDLSKYDAGCRSFIAVVFGYCLIALVLCLLAITLLCCCLCKSSLYCFQCVKESERNRIGDSPASGVAANPEVDTVYIDVLHSNELHLPMTEGPPPPYAEVTATSSKPSSTSTIDHTVKQA